MPISVAILVYQDADPLDFGGPLGILSSSVLKDAFSFTIIAQQELTTTCAHLRVPRDMSIDEAHRKLSQFDILLVPGGSVDSLAALAQNTDSPEVNFVKAFSQQSDRPSGSRQRTIFSVCSGALILGAAEALAGITATTHHLCLDLLRDQCAKHEGRTNVVHSRYEVGNSSPNGIRVLTAGGVTAGMDAACYLVSLELSMTDALEAAKMNEFTWQTKDETIYPSY